MRTALVILSWAVATGATGCMGGMMVAHGAQMAPPEGPAPGGMGAMQMQAQTCPMAVPGTQVVAADTPDGESITFTTSPDRAADLRTRVHAMAEMHGRHHEGGGMEGMHGGTEHGGMTMGGGMMGGGMAGSAGAGADHASMAPPPPSRATAEDVEGGARVLVTPNDPADLARLQAAVRTHVQHMQETGTCGMAHGGGT